MRSCWPARCLPGLLLLLALTPVSRAGIGYRPLVVLARDADTRQPIPGAVARITYPANQSLFGPGESSGTTGSDGVVRLHASTAADNRPLLEVWAAGYLSESRLLPAEVVNAIPPVHLFEDVGRRPVAVVLELYADKPLPTVELVLPAGYRGLVQVEIKVPEDAPGQPGRRTFSYPVPPDGAVRVTGPAVLGRFAFPNFSARYADGTRLGPDVRDAEMGFWKVKSGGSHHTFLVGTRAEHELYRSSQPVSERGESQAPGGGGRGGGRGRGRHGS